MGPIDYSTQVANPFMQALQGYQGGAAIRDDQAQQAQIDAQLAEAKTEAEKARKAAVAMQDAGRALREEMARQPR